MKIGILSFAHHHSEAYIANLRAIPGVEVCGVADQDPLRGARRKPGVVFYRKGGGPGRKYRKYSTALNCIRKTNLSNVRRRRIECVSPCYL